MDASQYAALKAEVQSDPAGLGYAGKTADQVADLLNAPRAGVINRGTVTGGEIIAAVPKSEYAALAAADKAWLNFVVSAGSDIPWTATFVTDMAALFGVGTTARTNLVALRKRSGSRGEELGFGLVAPWDVARALAQ